jgi:hypothetical protein
MHKMSNLNKFKDCYQVLIKNPRLCFMKKKSSSTHKKCLNNFFGPIFLLETPYVLMCIKCMNETRTNALL